MRPERKTRVLQGLAATAAGLSIVASAVAALVLWGVGFGVMTDCTNNFSCTVDDCDPCATANAWLTGGLVALGVLFLVGIALVVAAGQAWRPRRTLTASVVALILPGVVVLAAGFGASQSYCNDPNEPAVDGGPNYCDVK